MPLFEIGPDSPVLHWATGAARISDPPTQEFVTCPSGHVVANTHIVQNLTRRLISVGPEFRRMDSWQCPQC